MQAWLHDQYGMGIGRRQQLSDFADPETSRQDHLAR